MTAAERGATLTQRMLAFARKQELKLQNVDCIALVQGMADRLATTLGAGAAIETRFPLVIGAAHADPSQLELALLNLAVNARDAMPHGGRIVIEAAETMVSQDERPDLSAGSYIRLSVIDEGEGMDAATLERAREPFFTTKGIGKGTGLGLSMVHGFAQQCGGSLTITSDPGRGTAVSLWLPMAPMDADTQHIVALVEDRDDPGVPLVILAVDDDDLVLMNTAGMLEAMGHTVFQASSGADALRLLETGKVDLVVTDHAMPGMTGAELARQIRVSHPGLPIILASGYAEIPDEEGVADLVRLGKPFAQSQLASAIARCPLVV
jgi:CheY-like chemotaxis protein